MSPPGTQSAPANHGGRQGQIFESLPKTATKAGDFQAGKSELPQFIRDLLSAVPKHGDGVHGWLFKTARQLHAHRDFETIVSLLAVASEGCGRVVDDREIRAAVADAEKVAWQPSGSHRHVIAPAKPTWPEVDSLARKLAIEAAGITGIADLWHASPVPCTWDSTDAEFFADQLFPGNPLLCVGLDKADFRTAPREDFRGELSSLSLIVPSPMSAIEGRRKSDGEMSMHTLDNTGPRKFLVIESDTGTEDEQAAILWHLRQFAPLALVCSSGGKSLHGWFNCQGVAADITRRFMEYAVKLGADPKTWTPVQFVRLPQGWRGDKGRRQEVAFFDPSKVEGAPAQ